MIKFKDQQNTMKTRLEERNQIEEILGHCIAESDHSGIMLETGKRIKRKISAEIIYPEGYPNDSESEEPRKFGRVFPYRYYNKELTQIQGKQPMPLDKYGILHFMQAYSKDFQKHWGAMPTDLLNGAMSMIGEPLTLTTRDLLWFALWPEHQVTRFKPNLNAGHCILKDPEWTYKFIKLAKKAYDLRKERPIEFLLMCFEDAEFDHNAHQRLLLIAMEIFDEPSTSNVSKKRTALRKKLSSMK